jgi:hypothetical protein
LREATILLDLTIIRSRGSSLLEGRTKEPVQGAGKRPSKRLATLEAVWRCNGDAHKEVTTVWSKLFGGGDELPREKVDAVVHVIDRSLGDRNHRVSVARWLGVEALDAEVAELRAAVPIETAISARDLPERKSRWHLRPSVRPSYGPPAADGERSDRPAHARRGGGDRACP